MRKQKSAEEWMSVRSELLDAKTDNLDISVYAVVKAKDENGTDWKEVGDVVSISAAGAGFCLQRECRVGSVVLLMLPLPTYLRAYDHDKEFYRVWGLVQHCQEMSSDKMKIFHVGVAFIGKNPPKSYNTDPTKSYRVCGLSDIGLWKVEAVKTRYKERRYMRYWKSIDLYLALLDAKRDTVGGERTTTENISRTGAAVFCTLDLNVGDRVKFISKEYDFSGLAVVCGSQIGEDAKRRLHLQFVENKFPVETIDFPSVIAEKI